MSKVVGLPNNSYKPITNTACVRARICELQKGCTRLAVIKSTSCLPMVTSNFVDDGWQDEILGAYERQDLIFY
jgi:hypothetical protein